MITSADRVVVIVVVVLWETGLTSANRVFVVVL